MRSSKRCISCVCCAWAVVGSAASATDFEFRPVGGTGNEITIAPGDVVLLEVWVSNWGEPLRGIAVNMDPASLQSQPAGRLILLNTDADGDGACDAGLEAYCPTCSPFRDGRFGTYLGGMFIDDCRADHISRIPPPDAAGYAIDTSQVRWAWWIEHKEHSFADPGDGPFYVGTYVLQVELGSAQGTFTVDFLSGLHDTHAMSADSRPITPTNLTGALIHVVEPPYGDVTRDGKVDLQDILCVLDGFAGDFSNCPLEMVDIAPCEPDGIVDLGDILAALDAFQGNNPCGGP